MCVCVCVFAFVFSIQTVYFHKDWRPMELLKNPGTSRQTDVVWHTHMQTRDPFGRNTDTLDCLEPVGSPTTDSQGQAGAAPRVWRNLPSHPQVFCSCSKTRRYNREYIYIYIYIWIRWVHVLWLAYSFIKGPMQFRIVKFLKYAAWIFHRLSLASLKAPSNVHFFCLFIKNIFLNEM